MAKVETRVNWSIYSSVKHECALAIGSRFRWFSIVEGSKISMFRQPHINMYIIYIHTYIYQTVIHIYYVYIYMQMFTCINHIYLYIYIMIDTYTHRWTYMYDANWCERLIYVDACTYTLADDLAYDSDSVSYPSLLGNMVYDYHCCCGWNQEAKHEVLINLIIWQSHYYYNDNWQLIVDNR